MGGHIDRTHRLAALGIKSVELVSGSKPDVLTVIGDSVHSCGARKGAVFLEDFGCRSFHRSTLLNWQRGGE